MRQIFTTLLTAALLLGAAPLQADNAERFDGYTVHYNAFNADILDPRVAKAYQLRRGCGDGAVTIAVRRDDGTAAALPAEIKVSVSNLVGQHTALGLREVNDGRSIYYIGGFAIGNDAEPLRFTVTLRPEGAARERNFEFSRQLFRC